MIVCSCNVLSDHDVRASLHGRSLRPSVGALFRQMGCEPKCGRCARNLVALVDQHCGAGLDGCPGNGDCDHGRAEERAA